VLLVAGLVWPDELIEAAWGHGTMAAGLLMEVLSGEDQSQ